MPYLISGDDDFDKAFEIFVNKIRKEVENDTDIADKTEQNFIRKLILRDNETMCFRLWFPVRDIYDELDLDTDNYNVLEGTEAFNIRDILVKEIIENEQYYDTEQITDWADGLESLAAELRVISDKRDPE